MFEVNVKNVTEKGRRGGGGYQLGFGVLTRISGCFVAFILAPAESFVDFDHYVLTLQATINTIQEKNPSCSIS